MFVRKYSWFATTGMLVAFSGGCGGTVEGPKEGPGGSQMPSPDTATNEVMSTQSSSAHGSAEIYRIGRKQDALFQFKYAHGISEAVAEAAIKEWVMTHGGNFDWDLEDVKRICLRNQRSDIPTEYQVKGSGEGFPPIRAQVHPSSD